MAFEITSEERDAFKKTFDMFDKNKDGHITSTELATVLKELGHAPTQEEIDRFIKEVDTDENGTIEFNEFCRYLVQMRRAIFAEIDSDGNGYITAEELMRGFHRFGNDTVTIDQAREMVTLADTDGDGRVSYQGASRQAVLNCCAKSN